MENEKTITRIRKNGQDYFPSSSQMDSQIAAAQAAAVSANKAVVAATEVVKATQEVVGGYLIPHFDTGTEYSMYDLVLYKPEGTDELKLFRALVPHNIGDAWNPVNWFETSLYSEIKDMRSGSSEQVTITVTTWDGLGKVEGLSVGVTIISSGQVFSYTLDSYGQCTFSIPKLEKYSISIESLSGYRNIPNQTYLATVNSRTIPLKFERPNDGVEKLTVIGKPINPNGSAISPSPLIGLVVSVTTTDGDTYEQQFDSNNLCEFQIPYGKIYTINFPKVEGYHLWSNSSESITASVSSRRWTVSYRKDSTGNIFVMDDNGNYFSESEVDNMSESEKSSMKYLLYMDSNMSCFIKMSNSITSVKWSDPNTDFVEMGYITNGQTGDYNGKNNTDSLISLATQKGCKVPAAQAARNITVTIGSGESAVTKKGYLPAISQLWTFRQNIQNIWQMLEKCGYSPIQLTGGNWWSSSQFSATNAWILSNGSLDINIKSNAFQVLPFFDF